jgi:hypothetical protein
MRSLRISAACFLLAAFTLPSSAQNIPGWNEAPYFGEMTLSGGFSGDPRTTDVRAGGSQRNPVEGGGCTGWIGARPDLNVTYSTSGGLDLTISAAGTADVNLLVRAPDGRYFCDDDSGEGLNPLLTISSPPSGTYRIWVGTYAESNELVDGVVGISELGRGVSMSNRGGSSGAIQASNASSGSGRIQAASSAGSTSSGATSRASGSVPEWNNDPYFGRTNLSSGFGGDPHVISVSAGGAMANPLSGTGCTGYIGNSAPDAVVNFTAGSLDLTFSAAASSDLSLVVRAPNGSYYCDDDSGEGFNPKITINGPGSGNYQIWVGTYSESSELIPSRVGVSELGRAVN